MKSKSITLFCVFTVGLFGVLDGQVLGPPLDTHDFRVGYSFKIFHRGMERLDGSEWSHGSAFIQYGICRWLSLSLEAFVLEYTDSESNDKWREYSIGLGFVSNFWTYRGFRFSTMIHYSEVLYYSKTYPSDHQIAQDLVIGVLLDKKIKFSEQEATLWLAPVYIYDKITYWPPEITRESSDNLGVSVGVNFVFFKCVEPFAHVVYVEYLQPRIGLAFRL